MKPVLPPLHLPMLCDQLAANSLEGLTLAPELLLQALGVSCKAVLLFSILQIS